MADPEPAADSKAAAAPEVKERLPLIRGIGAIRDAAKRNSRSLWFMFAVWAVLIVIAVVIAVLFWRDDVARSTIAATLVLTMAGAALAIFGVKGPQTMLGIAGATAGVLALGGFGVTVDRMLPQGPPQKGALVDCPGEPDDKIHHGSTAQTDLGYVNVRKQPFLGAPVVEKYPPGCKLELTGYCIGDPKSHWRFHVPDPVWFFTEGDFMDGYIASADLRAGPGPRKVALPDCDGGRAPPPQPEITAPLQDELSGAVEISAAAPGASEVGFAAYYEDVPRDPASASWHQIGVDINTHDGVSAHWDTRSVPGQSGPQPAAMKLAAVPCLGLEFPVVDSIEVEDYVVANRGGSPPPSLFPPDPGEYLKAAGRSACDNEAR